MPKISDQKSAISNQNLKTLSIRKFLSNPRSLIPDPRGFTLIELLVVIAIIGILATVILANYNSFGSRQEVKNAAEELKSELRKYQTFAISGQKNPDQSGNCATSTLEAYVVDISSAGYTVTVTCTDPAAIINLTTVTFPTTNLNVAPSGAGCGASVVIRFMPIDQGVEICGDSVNTTASITFTRDSTVYTVNVNKSGEIKVQ